MLDVEINVLPIVVLFVLLAVMYSVERVVKLVVEAMKDLLV